jgi:diguanylate cyclase (GGDEF)-like protein
VTFSLVHCGGALFTGAGTLAAGSLLVPHGSLRNGNAALAIALAGVAFGAFLLAFPSRVRPWMMHTFMVVANVQIAIAMQFLGRGPMSVVATGFYVWAAIFAFCFFSWRAAAAHTAFMGICLAAALVALHEPAGPGIWLIAMGGAAGSGFVVGVLSRQLRHAAGTDWLTGLPNRWSWEEALDREISRATRTGEPLCVASIDLDGFKALNDARGHQAGDLYLRSLAASWTNAIRGNDVLARYGGDEFAVLLPDATRDQALAVIERMRAETPDTGFCSGVAEWDRNEGVEPLLGRADIAVYRAKAEGRNTTVVAADTAQP